MLLMSAEGNVVNADLLQARYHKALKQIDTLIDINRELKQMMDSNQEKYTHVTSLIQSLSYNNHILKVEIERFQDEIQCWKNNYHSLEMYVKKLEDLKSQMSEPIMKKHRQQEYEQLKIQNEQLLDINTKLQQQNISIYQLAKESHVEELQLKLGNSEQYVHKLIQECHLLKNQQIDSQVKEEKLKVERLFGLDNTNLEEIKNLINQYRQKIKDLELQKEYFESKYKQLKSTIKKQKKGNQTYIKKIESLEKLTEKQQIQISKMIEMYDKQLSDIHSQNVKINKDFSGLREQYVKCNSQILQKDKQISRLQLTTETLIVQKESLQKYNSLQNKLGHLNNNCLYQLPHNASYTIIPQNHQKVQMEKTYKTKQRDRIVDYVEFNNVTPSNTNRKEMTQGRNSTNTFPITVSYGRPKVSQTGNMTCIKSANIMNGFNRIQRNRQFK